MYDNKVRLSQDVLDKASVIASEWGLKNARAAVEAVFRRYADEYLDGTGRTTRWAPEAIPMGMFGTTDRSSSSSCEALNELDDLLGL
ncbi:hypothetical protein [Stenomitos frigidus]|uniref:Uncharacterized protein n=1 Tax=Stenomitos frigidus ULC18 TaxID=2107698 RepID=A0A2T1E6V8_9CYAN|nr:hypothetical protein [Stenomitos frigidus]PSB28473.1 hypothetical protein C7B82_13445 [Stenomitos frigidus ULC18]